jgi:hypothetical protein
VTITATDCDGLSATTTFPLTVNEVNEAPTLGGARSGQAVRDNEAVKPFAAFTVADPDTPAQVLTVTVRLSRPAHGRFSDASLRASGFRKTARGVYTFPGTAARAQAALRGLVFNPTENQVAPGRAVTTRFTVSASDGALSSSDGGTSVVARSV